MKYIFTFFLTGIFSLSLLHGQSLEEDINIIYMKANVLYDSERYDEAIRMYNRVINQDRNFVQAYLMRAKTKYHLGAFKGTKNDALEFIDLNGANKSVIKLMAATEMKLENYRAAKNYLITSLELDPYDGEQYKMLGDVFMILKDKNEACEQWSRSAKLGNEMAKELLTEYCDIFLHEQITEENESPDSLQSNSQLSKQDSDFKEDDIDRTTNEIIKVDNNLTLVIGNGLGTRKIEKVPDIFLMSNREGKVVINICVNGMGQVESTEYDDKRSNIRQQGLISLALRKSKEFEFFPSFRQKQCGYIIFDLKT